MLKKVFIVATFAAISAGANALTVESWGNSVEANLPIQPSKTDLLQGTLPVIPPSTDTWHPANSNPADKYPAFTDGVGLNGLAGLLNDFPAANTPTQITYYDLGAVKALRSIAVFSGNNGRDGRVYHTYSVDTSVDGSTWNLLAYVEVAPLGSVNNAGLVAFASRVSDPGTLVSAQYLRFNFYAVSNTQGRYQDGFSGVNPYTGLDDGFASAFESPLLTEVDVEAVPEPATLAALSCGVLALIRRRKA